MYVQTSRLEGTTRDLVGLGRLDTERKLACAWRILVNIQRQAESIRVVYVWLAERELRVRCCVRAFWKFLQVSPKGYPVQLAESLWRL